MYQLIRRLLFLLPAEAAHYFSMNCLKAACSIGFVRKLLRQNFAAPSQTTELFGLSFKNPVGLGAGFDKNAKYLRELEVLGFGFVEIGTVTPRPQAGNDKPRLFRLPQDKALINRMGFNNDGVEAVVERLKRWRKEFGVWNLASGVEETQTPNSKPQTPNLIVGGNIGKNKTTPNEEAWKDYEICFRSLHPFVDFFVVNVSSPNTPGLRELQEKESLRKILTHLQGLNKTFSVQRPILLKIAPDLTNEQIDDVISLAQEIDLDGLVATNTTISRDDLQTPDTELQAIGAGGLSGKPVEKRSTEVLQYIHQKTGGHIPVIGSGGIFTADDAKQKRAAGALLVEVWTGFIYEGPSIVRNICKGLAN
ncbi:MAG TPA: quinone-dependent dihydroorotate dehydrogenase [Flavisolibacter sp.]|nr:quinone-dependent dihydroorotate dehydrogenase [Flavisolibacter sp.]